MKKFWQINVLDCPHGEFYVLIYTSSEIKARKHMSQCRINGVSCLTCSQEKNEPVRHYQMKLVKKS